MNVADSFLVLERYGLLILPALVGAEQLGVPVPAAPLLIGFGALAAAGRVSIPLALGVIALVALSVDFGWYELGRRRGTGMLAGLSRVSLEPHSYVRRAHNVFARCGVGALLVSKFVPGVTVVVALLAGRVAVSRVRFLLYDVAGLWLWAGLWIGAGYVFSEDVAVVAASVAAIGSWLALVVVVVLGGYVSLKYARRRLLRLRTSLDAAAAPYAIPDSNCRTSATHNSAVKVS
jgi:membrane protein DedA with SNARE-associated domain